MCMYVLDLVLRGTTTAVCTLRCSGYSCKALLAMILLVLDVDASLVVADLYVSCSTAL